MTRAQRKEAYNKLQHALGRNLTRDDKLIMVMIMHQIVLMAMKMMSRKATREN